MVGPLARAQMTAGLLLSKSDRWQERALLAIALDDSRVYGAISDAVTQEPSRGLLLISFDALAGSGDAPEGTCWVRLGETVVGRRGLAHELLRAVKVARTLEFSGIGRVDSVDPGADRCARLVNWMLESGISTNRCRLIEHALWIMNPRHIRRVRREQQDHNDDLRTLFRLGEPDVTTAADAAAVPRAADSDPVKHFLQLGQYAGVDPHPLFWTRWYAEHFVSKQGGAAPWTHFSARIGKVLRPPNPFLLPSWYGQATEAYKDHENPVLDLLIKAQNGHEAPDPNPLFDQAWYRATHGLDRSEHPSCLMHFLRTDAQLATSDFIARHPAIARFWTNDCLSGPSAEPSTGAPAPSRPDDFDCRVAVCTAVTGNYDVVSEVHSPDPGFEYFLFSDTEPNVTPETWRPFVLPAGSDDTVLESRRLKMQLHRLVPRSERYDVLVYVDANIDLLGSLRPLVSAFLASGKVLGLVPHPFRRCAYIEAASVVLQERDDPDNIRRSVHFLEQSQVPDDAGLYEMGLFMVRPGPAAAEFLDLWWRHYQRLGRRDQLLVPAILQELKLPAFGLMPPGQSVRNHPDFMLRTHGPILQARRATPGPPLTALTKTTVALSQSVSGFFSVRSLREIVTKAIALLQREGIQGLYAVMREEFVAESAYRRAVSLGATDMERDEARLRQLQDRPLLSVLMPVYDPPEAWLREAIESVRRQVYPDWELCIADDASPSAYVRQVLSAFSDVDPRIRVVFREDNGHISAASNSALELVTGEFVILLDHDDELAADALLTLAEVISAKPDVDVIYSDEDKVDAGGRRHRAYFKPDWNPDLFCGQNLISHLGAYRTDRVRAVGGFREGYEGSQDWDLAARIIDQEPKPQVHHIPRVLYHWRVLPGSTALTVDEKDYAVSAARRAIQDHCDRNGWKVALERVSSAQFRVVHSPRLPHPLVSLVLYNFDPNDAGEVMQRLCDATAYRPLEFVLCGLEQPLESSNCVSANRCSVVALPDSDVLSEMLNRAVQASRGEIVCLFDGRLQPSSTGWLQEMVGHAGRDGIGAVGGKQIDPRGLISHAGYLLDDRQMVVEPYRGRAEGLSGYRNRARLAQNLSAISGACLVIQRRVWDEVGGLDQDCFVDACADIDLCLRLLDKGYRNLWTPYAVVKASERPRMQTALTAALRDHAPASLRLRQAHAELFLSDPAFNPNLEVRNGMPQYRVRR